MEERSSEKWEHIVLEILGKLKKKRETIEIYVLKPTTINHYTGLIWEILKIFRSFECLKNLLEKSKFPTIFGDFGNY